MENKIKILGIFTILILFSCGKNTSQKENIGFENKKKEPEKTLSKSPLKLDSINVVSLKEEYIKGVINLYNLDESLWKSFEITDNFADKSLSPFALKAENSVLVFRCVGRKNNYYAIVVDETKNTIRYIKAQNPYFNYETWQKHIIKRFSVDFNNLYNPLKTEPSNKSKTLPFDKEQFYHPVEIKGNWLKIKDDNEKKSWIKWIDEKGELIITLYYDA